MKNPFKEILPPLYDFDTFALKTRCYPKFESGGRDIEKIVALNKFYDYFEPQVITYDFYAILASVLYGGYDRRTPDDLLELIHKSISLEPETIYEMIRRKSHTLNPSGCITSIGYPGMGKTLTCLKIQSLFPFFFEHKNLGMIQIPILKIDCPEKGTVLQLAKNFFARIDNITGKTKYSDLYRNATEPELLKQMVNKSVIHYIGVLILDECQNLKVVTERESELMMNFLKFLNNEFKVPVIFVGTPQAEKILMRTLQTASRGQSSGAVKWGRSIREEDLDEDDRDDVLDNALDWDLMIDGLWTMQVLECGELTKEIKDTYYKFSQGIYRLLITLHMAAQRIAISNGWTEITPEILKLAAREQMYLTIKMVLALENKESHILRLFEDINESERSSPKKAKPKGNEKSGSDLFELAKVVHSKIDLNILKDCVAKVLSDDPNLNLESQAQKLKELIDQLPKTKKNTTVKKQPASGELLDITQNAETSLDAYNLLKEAGIIKSLSEFIEL